MGKMLVANLTLAAVILVSGEAISGMVTTPGNYNVKVTSLREINFRSVIRQQYDYSCGSAALATLLTFHYEDPKSEQEVFREMFAVGNQEKIRLEGFSLLDMKKYLEKTGYRADGFRITLDKLRELQVPAIVLLNNRGYNHFVVVKGVESNQVLVGDPSLGSRILPRKEFEGMWNGLVFLVRNKKNIASEHFNASSEWNYRGKPPLGLALSERDLAGLTLTLPRRDGF